jgi:hypothetical protein
MLFLPNLNRRPPSATFQAMLIKIAVGEMPTAESEQKHACETVPPSLDFLRSGDGHVKGRQSDTTQLGLAADSHHSQNAKGQNEISDPLKLSVVLCVS